VAAVAMEMHPDIKHVLYSQEALQARITQMGRCAS
jgi:hypothetical protein